MTQPDGNMVKTSYSSDPTLYRTTAVVTDEIGNQKKYGYDAFQRLTSVWEPDGSGALNWETDYAYTALDEVTGVVQKGASTDATQWRPRTFTYDSVGREVAETVPESGSTQFVYDANGNLKSKTDSRSLTINYTYDALDRMLTQTSADIFYSYRYDEQFGTVGSSFPVGHLTTMMGAPNVGQRSVYDPLGHVLQTQLCMPSKCDWTTRLAAAYDWQGNVASLTYPDGRVVGQTFDSFGRLSGITYAKWGNSVVGTPYFIPTSYAPPGQLLSAKMGNGLVVTAAYGNRQTLSSLSYDTPQTNLWGQYYTWDKNAMNLLHFQAVGADEIYYGYDTLNRLTSAQSGRGRPNPISESYTLDAWGNLRQSGTFTFQPTGGFTNGNRINDSGYTYDQAGNLKTDGLSNTFTYDSDGKMSSATGVSYTYGADSLRVRKDSGTLATEYIYFGHQMLARYDPASAQWSDLIYAGGQLLAEVTGTQTSLPQYRLTDHLGSLVALTDNSGVLLGRVKYAPFGQILTNSTTDRFLFTGLERDQETFGDAAWFREYVAAQGRWTRPDPYAGSYNRNNPQSLNRYSYVNSQPLNLTDPSGEYFGAGAAAALCSDPFACLAIGGGIGVAYGLYEAFSHLFGAFFGPSFDGSVQPRPTPQTTVGTGTPVWNKDPGSFGESLGVPTNGPKFSIGIGAALGFPNAGCEFGACGAGLGFQQGGQESPSYYSLTVNAVDLYLFGRISTSAYSDLTDPNHRLFGTHYCGPGGGGSPVNGLDRLCQAHDICYSSSKVSWVGNLNPFTGGAAMGACDAQLCSGLRSLQTESSQEESGRRTTYYFLGCGMK